MVSLAPFEVRVQAADLGDEAKRILTDHRHVRQQRQPTWMVAFGGSALLELLQLLLGQRLRRVGHSTNCALVVTPSSGCVSGIASLWELPQAAQWSAISTLFVETAPAGDLFGKSVLIREPQTEQFHASTSATGAILRPPQRNPRGVPLGYRSARGTLHKRREEQAEKTKRLRMLRAD